MTKRYLSIVLALFCLSSLSLFAQGKWEEKSKDYKVYSCKINHNINRAQFDTKRLNRCLAQAEKMGHIVHIQVLGSTSATGPIALNKRLAELRALKVSQFFLEKNKNYRVSASPSPYNEDIGQASRVDFSIVPKKKNSAVKIKKFVSIPQQKVTENIEKIQKTPEPLAAQVEASLASSLAKKEEDPVVVNFTGGGSIFVLDGVNDGYGYFSLGVQFPFGYKNPEYKFFENWYLSAIFSLYPSNKYVDLYEYTLGLTRDIKLTSILKLSLTLENSLIFNFKNNPTYDVGGTAMLLAGVGQGFYLGISGGFTRAFQRFGVTISKEL